MALFQEAKTIEGNLNRKKKLSGNSGHLSIVDFAKLAGVNRSTIVRAINKGLLQPIIVKNTSHGRKKVKHIPVKQLEVFISYMKTAPQFKQNNKQQEIKPEAQKPATILRQQVKEIPVYLL